MKEIQPTTEREKKDYYRERVTKSLETAETMKKRQRIGRKITRFPPPTPEQQEFMDTHDMYGNPIDPNVKVKDSDVFNIKIERRL